MGSVKDLEILKRAASDSPGKARFIFSDRYSVFDWGEMPDHIEKKGEALAIATAYFFEKLEKEGIKTHYLGLVEDGEVKRIDELKGPTNILEFKLLRVIKPTVKMDTYDYFAYQKEERNFLIPLEIIYRNSLPEGSSVFKRLSEGSLKLEDMGLKEMPKPGQVLEKTFLDVSTKLEATDRYIDWEEARKICNLSKEEIEEIKQKAQFINDLIAKETRKLGLFNEDGKVEFGFDEERNLILVDAVGTPDECRFTYEGLPVSKEIARIFYRKTSWYKDVEDAKKMDKVNWKSLVKTFPQPLPDELAKLISLLYKGYTNELTGREWFDTLPLSEVLNSIRKYCG